MNAKEKAVEILKDKSVYDDDYFEFIHKALNIAIIETKKEIFNELDGVRITEDGNVKLETFFDYKDIKKRHLSTFQKEKEFNKC